MLDIIKAFIYGLMGKVRCYECNCETTLKDSTPMYAIEKKEHVSFCRPCYDICFID